MIRLCADPGCHAVYHNVTNEKKCLDCGAKLITINYDQWLKDYKDWYFQYDIKTHEYLRPKPKINQLSLF